MSNKPRVVLGTVVWDTVGAEFLLEWSFLLASCVGSSWDASFWTTITMSCLLPVARNRLLIEALRNCPDFTHVLMIDSDVVGLRVEDVRRLVEHNVPIVAALVTKPKPPCDPACDDDDGYAAVHDEMAKDEPGLVERRWVGTGCILIHRDVIDKTAMTVEMQKGNAGTYWFRQGREERIGWERDMEQHIHNVTRRTVDLFAASGQQDPADAEAWAKHVGDELAELHMESFLVGRGCWDGGTTLGEDIEFGLRARALGFKSYIDCGVALHHIGPRGHGIDDHLESRGFEVEKRHGRSLVGEDDIPVLRS